MMWNPEIASVGPLEFARRPGIAYLYDNPGRTFGDGGELVCEVEDGDHALYAAIRDAFRKEVGVVRMMESYGYCPVPASSYHVTVADVINSGALPWTAPDLRHSIERVLDDIPRSLERPLPCNLPLLLQPSEPVCLRVLALVLLPESGALAIQLVPVGETSESAFCGLLEQWSRVRQALAQFGLPYVQSSPNHLVLGYFARKHDYDRAGEVVEEWSGRILPMIQECRITFVTVSLYGYLDAASYCRRYAAMALSA